jgi:hypothetical protein
MIRVDPLGIMLAFLCAAPYTLIRNRVAKAQINSPSIPGYYQPWFIVGFLYVFSGVGIGLAYPYSGHPVRKS